MKIHLYALIVAVSVLCFTACTPEDGSQSNSVSAERLDDQSVSTFSDDTSGAMDENAPQENSTALSDESSDVASISQDTAEEFTAPDTTDQQIDS